MKGVKAVGVAAAVAVIGVAVIVLVAPRRNARWRRAPTQRTTTVPTIVTIRLGSDAAPLEPAGTSGIELKAVEKSGNWNDVYLRKPGGEWIDLTKFRRPQHLHDFKASPDGQWVYVWHEAYPPRELSIYETSTGRRVGNSKPGLGGDMDWVVNNRIYHVCCFSTGAGCRYAFYDVRGNTVREGYSLCPDVSPSGRFFVTCSNHPLAVEPLVIRDLADWSVLCSKDLGGEGVCVRDLAWTGDSRLDVTDSTGRRWRFVVEAR